LLIFLRRLTPHRQRYSYSPPSSAALRASRAKTWAGGCFPAPPVTDLTLTLQKHEAVQSQHRPDHVLAHPLSIELGLRSYPAVDVKAGEGTIF